MTWNHLWAQAAPIILQTVLALLSIAGSWLVLQARSRLKTDEQRTLFDMARAAVAASVRKQEQVTLGALRDAGDDEDGLTAEETAAVFKAAFRSAVRDAKAALGPDSLKKLAKALGGEAQVDGVIGTMVEASVHELKQTYGALLLSGEPENDEETEAAEG